MICKCSMEGFFLSRSLYRELHIFDQCGRWFLTYTAIAVRLAQSVIGTSALNERARLPSNKVLLNHSAMPLDCEEYRAVFSCTIPSSSRKVFIVIEINSSPQSVWSILILHPSFLVARVYKGTMRVVIYKGQDVFGALVRSLSFGQKRSYKVAVDLLKSFLCT